MRFFITDDTGRKVAFFEYLESSEICEDFDDDYYVFVKELACESPIKAASVVLGHIQTDAWDLIVNEKNETLREVFRK